MIGKDASISFNGRKISGSDIVSINFPIPCLSPGDIDRVVRRIAYKPGWSFTVSIGETAARYAPMLTVVCETIDARDQKTPLTIKHEQLLNPITDEPNLLRIIRSVVRTIEAHEIDEWLKCDGEHVSAPHEGEIFRSDGLIEIGRDRHEVAR